MAKPVKYEEKYCQMLIDHCRNGHDISSFGSTISVSRATLYAWMKKYPDFKFAHEQGIGWLKMQAMNTLWEFANGDKPKGASVLAAIYLAKLYGYREDKPIDADLEPVGEIENKNDIRLSYNLEKKATLEELKKEELMTEAEFTEILESGDDVEEQGQSENGKEEL